MVQRDNFSEGFRATLMRNREVVGKRYGHGHSCARTQIGVHMYEGAGMQAQVSSLKYKQALFYTHAHSAHYLHSKPQDVKQPSETLCEVPIDGH